MRLLDIYALNCGAKIHRPFIYETYFPLPLEKFITFQAQAKYESKDYAYWQDVINIINPVLIEKKINIIQLGQPNEMTYQNVVDLRGKTSLSQLAYVIKNSFLHFGPDSLGIHMASAYNVPIVGLYSIIQPEVAGPHFGSPDKQILFKGYERVGNKKPSYSPKESPKSINTIKPEEIANAIFKLLGLDSVTPFETVYTGTRYSSQMLRELLLDSDAHLENPDAPVELRYDLTPNMENLSKKLAFFKKGVIVSDKIVDLKFLQTFKPHIPVFVYRVTNQDNPEFVKDVIALGINVLLVSNLDSTTINQKKINYYEFGVINSLPKPDDAIVLKLKPDLDNLYFKSCKLIGSDGKVYASHAHRLAGININNSSEYQKVIDTADFWNDMDFYTIVKKLDKTPNPQ